MIPYKQLSLLEQHIDMDEIIPLSIKKQNEKSIVSHKSYS
jgi:hypothetical protein